jgi:small subunit ribosomal protein S1
VVSVGQEVEVEVLDVDLERERVSLSLKATQEDPWKEFERKYQAGEIIDGQVTKLVPFGAFVRVAQGIEGLVHISELSDQHVDTPESVLSVGEQVRVKVIEVDVPRRRISLSMRQVGGAMPKPATEIEEESAPEPVAAPLPEPVMAEAQTASGDPSTADRTASTEAVVEEETEPVGAEAMAATAPSEARPEATPAEAPEPEQPAAETTPAPDEEEDVSLEAILEDLKRREGRSE